jgi:hypothetical protein
MRRSAPYREDDHEHILQRTDLQHENRMPTILAIGDSWFWYPFPAAA